MTDVNVSAAETSRQHEDVRLKTTLIHRFLTFNHSLASNFKGYRTQFSSLTSTFPNNISIFRPPSLL